MPPSLSRRIVTLYSLVVFVAAIPYYELPHFLTGNTLFLNIMLDSQNPPVPTHPKETLTAAYQLRYHFGWYAYKRKPSFDSPDIQSTIQHSIKEIAFRYGYHVLALDFDPDAIRCLISLLPTDCPSEVTRIVKGNLSSQLRNQVPQKLWSRGWFVRSNGNVCRETVENYVANQREHHRETPIRMPSIFSISCFTNHSVETAVKKSDHAVYQNDLHFVFCVCGRKELIDAVIAVQLQEFWLEFLRRQGWVCSTMNVLRDHVHLTVSMPLNVSPQTAAFRMLNNAEQWFSKRWTSALRIAEVDSLFQCSYYVGTYGEVSTARIEAYLTSRKDSML